MKVWRAKLEVRFFLRVILFSQGGSEKNKIENKKELFKKKLFPISKIVPPILIIYIPRLFSEIFKHIASIVIKKT